MSLFHEFDTLRSTVNSMLGDFGSSMGGRGYGRVGRRHQAAMPFGRGFADPFGWDEDLFEMPLMLGAGEVGVGGGQQAGGKDAEESKMEDVQPSQQGGGVDTQLAQRGPGTAMTTFQPHQFMRARVNIEDAKDKYIVTAEVPGFDKANIKVNVTDDGLLHIKGEQTKEWTDQSKDKKYLRAERTFSNIQRTLRLPRGVDASKISANYENGILHVNLPKSEEQQKKSSEIQIQ